MKHDNITNMCLLDCCLHHIIEKQAGTTPQRTALRYEKDSLSYQELNSRANQVAHYLKEYGVVPDSIVGICVERSFEMVIGLLGILKAGGAYVPIDPEYPAKRIEYIINDAHLSIVLTQKKFIESFRDKNLTVICLESDDAAFVEKPRNNPVSTTTKENLAYVIYTSGSTGNPKGAMNTHQGIVNRLVWMQDTYQLTGHDGVIQKTPFSFDVSVWELFWPLMFGAKMVIAKPYGHKDTDYLLDLIEQENVTIIHFVPSMLRLFLEGKNIGKTKSLRDVIVSGETLTYELQEQFFDKIDARLHNLYGPTEAAVDVTSWECQRGSTSTIIPIGKPIDNIQIYILDDNLKAVPAGEEGEIYIGGVGVGRGYLNQPELTKNHFLPDPFIKNSSARIYKTGDLGRYLPDGTIEYRGRIDFQVKIRGFRIELGEIEAALLEEQSIRNCVVVAREDTPGDKRLAAYIVEQKPGCFSVSSIRHFLKDKLPEYMIPATFVVIPSIPLNANGKVDRKALPLPQRTRPALSKQYIAPYRPMEKMLERLWCEVLDLDLVGLDDNFFELGGNSLLALRMIARLHQEYAIAIPVVKLFQYPSIALLSGFLEETRTQTTRQSENEKIEERAIRQRIGRFSNDPATDGVAIIGMAGRFPGAATLTEFWDNLCNEIESISHFSLEELGPGIDPSIKNDPHYVRARGIVDDADKFDAAFFGISPNEAKVMDPQQRVFLELAWSALEHAGYDSESFDGLIGVYAGVGDNNYYPLNLLSHPQLLRMVGDLVREYGNEKDYIATRVSFHLDLTGPSVSANTGCSTSLLAVDNAFRALLDHECDIALAGGSDIRVPQKCGFLYQVNGTFSIDGHCRPFDSEATGTMFCDGAGVVVLKRLSDALADRDTIYAVIRGSAKNNDGAQKASFLAPSVEGQAQVIAMALANANISPDTISYIEAHGTGTPLGDPIEIEALTKAFRSYTDKKQFCYIGSVKGNIGHPTIASGVANLIKATLCLYNEKIPPLLHYRKPNPKIDFENSPFVVVDTLTPWPRTTTARRAGVSSFGFGGTNVHTILEEAPAAKPSAASRPVQLLLLSAKTDTARQNAVTNFLHHLSSHPGLSLADAAFTLQQGRRHFGYRYFAVAQDIPDAVQVIQSKDPIRSGSRPCKVRNPRIVFMFPGQGAQYINMGRNLYDTEPLFKDTVDQCSDILQPHLKHDLRQILYPKQHDEHSAYECLKNTFFTQPAIFTIEYSLAVLWKSWGIQPYAMIGHSIGEFVAARLAGVFSLEDALGLVALRGELMSELPSGSMLSLRCSAESIESQLPDDIQLAAANGPSLCVVSGPSDSIASFQAIMEKEGIICRHLHTSHAFHSAMMDPIVEPFTQHVAAVPLSPPSVPFVSTVTAQWITPQETTDPSYWGKHLRMPVRFSQGINGLLSQAPDSLFLEVGPRNTLTTLTRQHALVKKEPIVCIASLIDTAENNSEWTALLTAMGQLWLHGTTIDWKTFSKNEHRQRIPLPTYPFERKRYWVDPQPYTNQLPIEQNDYELTDTKETKEINTPPVQTTPAENIPRKQRLISQVKKLIEKTAEIDVSTYNETTATFLDMGMDSLFLTQIAFQIQTEFGLKITFGHLMRDVPTIAALAAHIDQNLPPDISAAPAAADSTPPTNPVPKSNEIPLSQSSVSAQPNSGMQSSTLEQIILEQTRTINQLVTMLEKRDVLSEDSSQEEDVVISPPSSSNTTVPKTILSIPTTIPQRGIWYSSKLGDNESCAYNESISVQFDGTVDIEKLRHAVEALLERHDALRARFSENGKFMQIAPSLEIQIPLIDISASHGEAQQQKWQRFVHEEMSKPFDLKNGPLFRSCIVTFSPQKTIVVLTGHHIICDGWSLDVLIYDLCAFYDAYVKHMTPKLKPVQSYSEYTVMADKRSKEQSFERARTYWNTLFAEKMPLLHLPIDHPRPALRNYKARRCDWKIPHKTIEALRSIGKQKGCSLFTALLASLSVFLYRITRQKEFIIGLPTAEQPLIGQNELVGHCVNLIPFKACVDPKQSFIEFLSIVQQRLFESYEHQEYTMISLLEDIRHTNLCKEPFVSVGLTHVKKYKREELPCSDAAVDYFANPKCFESFELYYNAIESTEGVEITCHYNTAIFEHTTIIQWLEALQALIEDITLHPHRQLSVLSVVPLQYRQRYMHQRKKNRNDAPKGNSIESCLEKYSRNDTHRTAIIWDNTVLTRKELSQKVDYVVANLHEHGIGPGRGVGVMAAPSVDYIPIILGIFKAGARLVCFDTQWSKAHQKQVMADSGADMVVIFDRCKVPSNRTCVEAHQLLQPRPTVPVNARNDNADTHTILYSTYTTSSLKKIPISAQNALESIQEIAREIDFDENETILTTAPLHSDLFLHVLLLCLYTESSLHYPGNKMNASLIESIRKNNVTAMIGVPLFWKTLLESGFTNGKGIKALCTRGRLTRRLAAQIHETGASLWNLYGFKETGGWVSLYRVPPAEPTPYLGYPLKTVTPFIVDEMMQPVPFGVPGKLCIGRNGTAADTHPAESIPVEEWYFNGDSDAVVITDDIVRWRTGDMLEFIGKKEHCVDYYNYTVNLELIEITALHIPGVKQTHCCIRKNSQTEEKRLVLYYCTNKPSQPTAQQIMAVLRQEITDQPIPDIAISVDSFVITQQHHIDSSQLPDPFSVSLSHCNETQLDETSRKLIELWKKTFKRDTIALDDNFFELGGHSLLAAQLFEEIEKTFRRTIPLSSLYHSPTLRQITALLKQDSTTDQWSSLVPIRTEGNHAPLFLIHGAEGNVLLYRDLAHYLGENYPVYGLQSAGLDGKEPVDPTFERVAERYLNLIRSVQAHGPYFIGGYCLGGTIALEVAQQLVKKGEKIALLVMFENYNIKVIRWPMPFYLRKYNALLNVAYHVGNLLSKENKAKRKFFTQKAQVELERFKIRMKSATVNVAGLFNPKMKRQYRHLEIGALYDEALTKYEPKPYPGKITLFMAHRRLAGFNTPLGGWADIAKQGVELHEIAVNPRGTLVEPYVQTVAEKLRACIDSQTAVR